MITINGKEASINIPLKSKDFIALIEEYEQSLKEMIAQGHDKETYSEATWDGFINYLIGNYPCLQLDQENKWGLVIPMFAY